MRQSTSESAVRFGVALPRPARRFFGLPPPPPPGPGKRHLSANCMRARRVQPRSRVVVLYISPPIPKESKTTDAASCSSLPPPAQVARRTWKDRAASTRARGASGLKGGHLAAKPATTTPPLRRRRPAWRTRSCLRRRREVVDEGRARARAVRVYMPLASAATTARIVPEALDVGRSVAVGYRPKRM